METLPNFEVLTNTVPKNYPNLKKIIAERTLLKTKLKLLQIEAFDHDLELLQSKHLTLPNLNLTDFYLTTNWELLVPLKNNIIPGTNPTLTLSSYLIYLSYLYNFDFVHLKEEDLSTFIKIVFSLNIPVNLKSNLLNLLNNGTSPSFKENLKELFTPLFRENLEKDKSRLRKIN